MRISFLSSIYLHTWLLLSCLSLPTYLSAFTVFHFSPHGQILPSKLPSFILQATDNSESDDDIIQMLRGTLGNQVTRAKPKTIVIMSDTTGVTAKSAVEKSLAQFNGCDDRFLNVASEDGDDCEMLRTKIFPFVRNESEIAMIIKQAADQDAMVVYTFADPEVRETTARMCELANVLYVNLLGPMFAVMSGFFQRAPLGVSTMGASDLSSPRRRRALSDTYFRRIEAVEFTLKADDGMAPWLLSEADVILLGVSRTGKTPLSVVISQSFGLKVANIPLVVDIPPPAQLFYDTIDPKRVFCLTVHPADLQRIRKSRLERELQKFGQPSTYADRDYLMRDLRSAKQLAAKQNFTEIDVTGRAVEETASLICSMLNERFPPS